LRGAVEDNFEVAVSAQATTSFIPFFTVYHNRARGQAPIPKQAAPLFHIKGVFFNAWAARSTPLLLKNACLCPAPLSFGKILLLTTAL
jgi:hypothetical protein